MSCKEGLPCVCVHFLRERQMKRICSNCLNIVRTDGGFCINRVCPVEFVLKSEENHLLCQILSKMEFPTYYY